VAAAHCWHLLLLLLLLVQQQSSAASRLAREAMLASQLQLQ
jgi:hypothetical protein